MTGTLKLGLLRLTDAAPVVMAQELGHFAEAGIDVTLCVEPSWANIADKLTYGKLDAAVLLPPLALAMALGLRGPRADVVVPMGLSLNGNSITVARPIAEALALPPGAGALASARGFAAWVRASGRRPRLAVVHVYSTHNLLLRYWLATQAIDPDRDVEIVVVPPAEAAGALADGVIDGFCAGAPWGAVAADRKVGRTICTSSEIWHDHPEKCLAMRGDLVARAPGDLARLVTAVLAAARYCDDPGNADHVAAVLARAEYLALPAALIRLSLPSAAADEGAAVHAVDRSVFAGPTANLPARAHAAWFLKEMARWGQVAADVDGATVVKEVYRPDLLIAPARTLGIALPAVAATTLTGFCDGAVFGMTAR